MKLETFFDKFNELADTPNAVPRMRRFILDLAVRGKLVAQDTKDEPADELLKRVQAEKARLIKSGEIKKQEQLPTVADDAIQFALPAGWAASQLGDVAVCLDYMREPINGTERDLRIAGKAESELFPYYGATQQQGLIDDYIFDAELILLGEDGVPFFDDLRPKAYLISGKTWVNNHAHVFRGILVSNPFVMHWLNTFDYTGRVAGSTRSKLNQAKAVDIPIALPPLAEQKRIVAKVDELMALCDRLEAQQQEREARHAALARASLARFADAPTPANLHFLFHPSYAIPPADLRKSILTLAVQGKLVPQDPNDEPAGGLLARIRAEKKRLVAQKEIGRDKEWSLDEEVPPTFELPASWVFSTLAEIGLINPRNEAADNLDASFVPMKLISAELRKPHAHEIRKWAEVRTGFTHFAEGDVALAKITPCFENGKSAVMRNLANGIGAGTTELHVVRPIFVEADYILIFLKSWLFVEAGIPRMTGTAGQKRVPTSYFAASPFPLPPLAEQRRIVAKVDQLMALVDQLEAQIAASAATAGKLMEAVVAELTAQA